MSDAIVLPKHPLFKNLTGQRFGRLEVIRYGGRVGKKQVSSWVCRCECGTEKTVTATQLQGGLVSCGCYRLERVTEAKGTHFQCDTTEYRTWVAIKDRCYNPKNKMFADYGGRGIIVCERWLHSFETFLSDMGPRPDDKESIDRIRVDGNYEPGNCRWADRVEQNRNKRSNRLVTWNGVTRCVSEWAEMIGLPRYTIEKRLDCGWSVERAMTTPKRGWSRAS